MVRVQISVKSLHETLICDAGMGVLANSLSLGCDCLGEIEYMDGVFCNHAGEPVVVKNAICIVGSEL